MKTKQTVGIIACMMLLASCTTHYQVTDISRSRELIDSRYDAPADQQAEQFMKPYKHVVDSMMGPVMGQVARFMAASRPESELSNLLADILVWAGEKYGEKPDFGLYNMAMCSKWHPSRTRSASARSRAKSCWSCSDKWPQRAAKR